MNVDQLENDAALISEVWFGDQPLSAREREFLADARALIAAGGHLSERQREWREGIQARRSKRRRC